MDLSSRSLELDPMENLSTILVLRIYAENRHLETVNDLQSATKMSGMNLLGPLINLILMFLNCCTMPKAPRTATICLHEQRQKDATITRLCVPRPFTRL
uniref:Uncharacterized protein n=1 Tax=Heterorhabditis bacteriophora TaxID=37862 RepID=A0A1I7XFI9_HETBA